MRLSRKFCLHVLSGVCLIALACQGSSGPPGPPASERRSPGLIQAAAVGGTFTLALPEDLQIHPMAGAVMGTTLDGIFRIYVAEIKPDTLLRLAGGGKETLLALGWRVESEQHLEKAIQVALTRGGSLNSPAEHRDVWWFLKDNTAYICDGITTPEGADRLGDNLRTLCQGVTTRGRVKAGETQEPVSAP